MLARNNALPNVNCVGCQRNCEVVYLGSVKHPIRSPVAGTSGERSKVSNRAVWRPPRYPVLHRVVSYVGAGNAASSIARAPHAHRLRSCLSSLSVLKHQRTSLCNHSGNKLQSPQSTPRRIAIPTSAACVSGRCSNETMKAIETYTRNSAAKTFTRNASVFHQSEALGCGMDNSSAPHCEQNLAYREFTCRRGQSRTS